MIRRSSVRPLAAIAVVALAVFAAMTVAVTTSAPLGIDSAAFDIADDIRAPWLDHVFRVITSFGLIAIVGSAVVIGAVLLIMRFQPARAAALVAGAALAWVTVWLTKAIVDRARPPEPLVHTGGQSYPSAHAANSVGWLALAIALTVVIPSRRGSIAAIVLGAVLAILVGLSRIYLRAHYASDVIAGEALAVAMYCLATIGAIALTAGRPTTPTRGA